MSATATWSTKAAPMAAAVGSVVLILGLLCIVHAALTVALGGRAWNASAYLCMIFALVLAGLRVRRGRTRAVRRLSWDAAGACFRLSSFHGELVLSRVWYGLGWVTLGLRARTPTGEGKLRHVVIWKSAIPAPLWNELALRIHAAPERAKRQENKENP